MSSRSSLFLTEDNEHCYEECNMPHYRQNIPTSVNFKGYTIVLEMSKKNIRIICDDEEDLIIEIDPGCELHDMIKRMKD